jgi:tetratricopeptide (TPR) repeat protein
MVSLARAHRYLYDHGATGSQSLEYIVNLMLEAITLIPPASSGPALFLLGDAYRFLYTRRNDSRFLREALVRLSAALEPERNLPTADRLDALLALAVCQFEAYLRYRRMEDLDRSVETFKRASEESGQSTTYARVANVLYRKYKATGDPEVLDEAIEFYSVELAVTENPDTKRGIGRRYFAYGKALNARFGVKHDIADLERAVEFFERAVRRAGREDLREWATMLERAREMLERTREERRREETPSPPPPQLVPLPGPPRLQLHTQTHVVAARVVESPEPITPITPTITAPINPFHNSMSRPPGRVATVAPTSGNHGDDDLNGNQDTTPKSRPRVLRKASALLSRSGSRAKASKMPTMGTLPQKQSIDTSALHRALTVIGVSSKWTRGR